MKKSEQIRYNNSVIDHMNEALRECEHAARNRAYNWKQLNTCQARYSATQGHYIVLESYATCVAAIDTRTGMCYDFSRYAYGYTATTCQHIYKFAKLFGATVISWKKV